MDKILSEVQDYISGVATHPNYNRAYRDEETTYWKHIPQWIAANCDNLIGCNVLDIGVAYGTLSEYCRRILGADCYAVDFITNFFPEKLKEKIHFKKCNIELDPVPWDKQFDLVIMTEVFEHFNFNPVATLKKVRRSMYEDGHLAFSTPEATIYGRKYKYYSDYKLIPEASRDSRIIDDHIFVYTWAEVLDIFNQAGFELDMRLHDEHDRHINAIFTPAKERIIR